MGVPWAQPETNIYVGPTITPTFPLTISPSPLQLLPATLLLGIDPSLYVLATESGDEISLESGYVGVAVAVIPNWVIPTSFEWSWKTGGVGIFIDNPTSDVTYFQTTATGNSGVAQCVVNNSLGGQAVATLNVSS
jgi:hypothetical protein